MKRLILALALLLVVSLHATGHIPVMVCLGWGAHIQNWTCTTDYTVH